MRPIEFRGYDEENKQWVYGGHTRLDNDHYIIGSRSVLVEEETGLRENVFDHVEVDPATIGQYTGLEDCEGKKIFEGDILVNGNGVVGYVIFENGSFATECPGHGVDYFGLDSSGKRWRKIGTIHDNPEFLEKKCTK